MRAVAYRIDAASVMARAAKAEADRRVTLRPAPDTMAYLTALLPVAQAVAAHAALVAAADTARAAADDRGKGQVMADTLVERVTGQDSADAVPVEVQLVITDQALLDGDGTPAHLTGYGPVPAPWVRDLLTRLHHATGPGTAGDAAGDAGAQAASVWLRRLFTHPDTGTLVAMDSTRRTFDGGLRRYLLIRDAGTCRTPWCDAPARHLDHIRDHATADPPPTPTARASACAATTPNSSPASPPPPSAASPTPTINLAHPTPCRPPPDRAHVHLPRPAPAPGKTTHASRPRSGRAQPARTRTHPRPRGLTSALPRSGRAPSTRVGAG